MNILFGLYHKDQGQIYINEEPVEINNPADAEKLGIGMVHQQFMLINQLTVWENVILGKEPGKILIDRQVARQSVLDIVKKFNFTLDIDQKVKDLSIGMKQRTEIIKLLYKGMDIFIFDEPTAVLTPQEADELFLIFDQLVQKRNTIIFITHKLKEIFNSSDYVTVLSRGLNVGTVKTKEATEESLAMMMVGHQIEDISIIASPIRGETVLKLEDVQLLPQEGSRINLRVYEGEVVGVAGVDGNGQMELEEIIIGSRECKTGQIEICGQNSTNLSTSKRKLLGVGYIPSDREKTGIMPQAPVNENILLGYQDADRYKKWCFVNYSVLEHDCNKYISDYEIKLSSISNPINTLSGGNQQKIVIAREVEKPVRFIIAAQPTRGLDIGATEYVHKVLLRLRAEGKGILLISAELSELLNMSDRIIVLHNGVITGEFTREEFSEEDIGLCMMGKLKAEIKEMRK
jgi:simple sugar transport system ATP-binding protein